MRKIAAALVVVLAVALAAAAAAAEAKPKPKPGKPSSLSSVPAINYGVADNTSFFADDGGAWFYGMLKGANLTENRWELQWDAKNPSAIAQIAFLERAAPAAQAAGVHVVLVLDSSKASNHDPVAFCTWAAIVATTAKQWGIHDFVVWNEPNTAVYWAPQDSSAPAAYEALLAKCYDAIHAADSQARVIGFGLSPRSNGPTQTAPIPFISGVGAAYTASGRTTPIMDQISIHPYPNQTVDSPDVGYGNPDDYGIPNLDRVKQALYDAFNGTGQPTTLNGLTFRIDELGWQTDTSKYSQYYNQENVTVISEQTQADNLTKAVQKYFACDPSVTDVELFLLVDEATRNGKDRNGNVLGGGWQSGLMTAGGAGVSTPKLAYTQLAPLFAQGRAACAGPRVNWTPLGAGSTGGGSTSSGGKGGGKPPGGSTGSAKTGSNPKPTPKSKPKHH